MKIANHLQAVYVPNMVIRHASRSQAAQRRRRHPEQRGRGQARGTPRGWWGRHGPKGWNNQRRRGNDAVLGKDETGGGVPPPPAAGGPMADRRDKGGRGATDPKSHAFFWAMFQGSHPEGPEEGEEEDGWTEGGKAVEALPSSTAPASYPTRKFPGIFLLLETSLLAYCLYRLWQETSQVLTCYILPPRASLPPSLGTWAAATYHSLLRSSSSPRRAASHMCFAYWPGTSPSPSPLPFLLRYHQTGSRSLLDIVMETGIFASTAFTLSRLLKKSYFFIDVEKYMDPACEPPYKNIHEHR